MVLPPYSLLLLLIAFAVFVYIGFKTVKFMLKTIIVGVVSALFPLFLNLMGIPVVQFSFKTAFGFMMLGIAFFLFITVFSALYETAKTIALVIAKPLEFVFKFFVLLGKIAVAPFAFILRKSASKEELEVDKREVKAKTPKTSGGKIHVDQKLLKKKKIREGEVELSVEKFE